MFKMDDPILSGFLEDSLLKGYRLAKQSKNFALLPEPLTYPPLKYVLLFNDIEYLSYEPGHSIEKVKGTVHVIVKFPLDYLRSVDQNLYVKIAAVLEQDFFHPNVYSSIGTICLGRQFSPGTPLDSLTWHIFDIITYRNFTVNENDALNPQACRFMRENPGIIKSLNNESLRGRRFLSEIKKD